MSILYFQLCYCSTLTSLDNRDTGSTFLYELYGCYWQYLRGRLAGIALKTELAWLRTLLSDVNYYSRLLFLLCGRTSSCHIVATNTESAGLRTQLLDIN